MIDDTIRDQVAPQVRMLQIIVVALVLGCILFAPVAMAVEVAPADPNEQPRGIITAVAMVLVVLAVPSQFILPQLVRAQARAKVAAAPEGDLESDVAQLLSGYQLSKIVAAACAEGAVYLSLIAYMLEKSPYSLAAAITMTLMVAIQFPTVGHTLESLEQELRAIDEQREIQRLRSV